jgi:hypothetical protein
MSREGISVGSAVLDVGLFGCRACLVTKALKIAAAGERNVSSGPARAVGGIIQVAARAGERAVRGGKRGSSNSEGCPGSISFSDDRSPAFRRKFLR